MDLFDTPIFDHRELVSLAERIPPLIHFGTSSWNYQGWQGLVYHRKYSKAGGVTKMLAEYAEFPLFRTVGVDAAFYRPLSPSTCRGYAAVLPSGFPLVQKVWNRITIHTFTGHQDGGVAGALNPDFFNADLCVAEVIGPSLEHLGEHAGPFVFEIQTIARRTGLGPEAFAERLDAFLAALPRGPRYAVELRNEEYLHPAYLAVMRKHGAAHVFNSWTRMPSIGEQLAVPGVFTAPFVVARALLRPGRTYEDAVDAFAPYDKVKEPNMGLRTELAKLGAEALMKKIPAYLLTNNRAEGSAPYTTIAVAQLLADRLSGGTGIAAGPSP
jgi:uncharacterized protein YecE (DUF72 family)